MTFRIATKLVGVFFTLVLAGPIFAQGASFAFGGLAQERDLPVEISSDQLAVDQNSGLAVFTGNVLIIQGEMRLSAPRVEVVYGGNAAGISQLQATGGVTLVSGPDAAEAQNADYDIDMGTVLMTGDVLVTQGQNVFSSERMELDLEAGTAALMGRVRTTIVPVTND